MTPMNELFALLAKYYYEPDILLAYAADPEGNHGDTLAKFIVEEITECGEIAPADKKAMLVSVLHALTMARDDLGDLILGVHKELEDSDGHESS